MVTRKAWERRTLNHMHKHGREIKLAKTAPYASLIELSSDQFRKAKNIHLIDISWTSKIANTIFTSKTLLLFQIRKAKNRCFMDISCRLQKLLIPLGLCVASLYQ
jgi:hypothetical protein